MTCPVVVNLRQHGAGKQLGYRSRGAGQDRVSWAFNTQPYMLEQFRLYITSTSAIGPNIRSETVLGNLKNDAWFDRELLAGVDTMSHPAERPATPAVPSTSLQESHPSILSESSGSESDPISSTSECPCCRLPPVPEPSTLGEAIPQLDLNNSVALEERFLKSLAIQPAVGSTVQAAAVVPRDRRAAGHYLLIDLLCHRLFSTFRHQGGIRNFSVYYYKRFIPGDTLTVVARRVFRSQLSWLEATVARDSVLVATATALYDAAGLEPEASAETLFTDFDGVHHCAVSDDRDLW